MGNHGFFLFLILSWIGAFITTFSFAVSSSGKFDIDTLFLPAVAQIASMAAIICGILLSPLMYWCLKDKNLVVALSILYGLSIVITILLNYIDQRIAFYGTFIFWIISLLLIKIFNIFQIVQG